MIKRTKKIKYGGKGYGLAGLSLETDEIRKIKKTLGKQRKKWQDRP